MKRLTTALLICLLCGSIARAALGPIGQRTVASIDSLMKAGLSHGYYPGATIAVGDVRSTLFDACYGWQDAAHTARVTPADVYDLASVTKVASTTLAVMLLYDQDRLRLQQRLGEVLPDFASTPIASLTMSELLRHVSGLGNISIYRYLFADPAGRPLTRTTRSDDYTIEIDKGVFICNHAQPDTAMVCTWQRDGYRRVGESCYVNPAIDTLLCAQIVRSYRPEGRGKYLYSDLNFHLLKLVVEHLTGMRLDCFVAPLYAQMGMTSTGYLPLLWTTPAHIIPTEDDHMMQRGLLRGYTHDEIAAVSDNVGGNAGLFSNAADLARYCRMLLGDGVIDGQRILSASTVRLFTSSGIGFNRSSSSSSMWGGYGHTGYTGTIIWMDPSRGRFMVFLSNRVHPTRTNQGLVSSMLRTKIWDAVKSNR